MSSSPWGRIQEQTTLAPGLLLVSTASHGGLLLSREAAERLHISPKALELGARWEDGWAYEEDCEWAILAWEVPQFWPALFPPGPHRENPRQYLLETLSAWCPDLLLSHGVTPVPGLFARYQSRQRNEELRTRRDPDLIVCARGSWAEGCPPGAVEVTTADGTVHYITEESYERRDPDAPLLSACVLFPMAVAV